MKVQWTEQLVATQQQKTEEIKKQTESLKAVADAERHKKVLAIELEKQVSYKTWRESLLRVLAFIALRSEYCLTLYNE